MESALCAYIAKEQDKALRRDFGAQEIDRNLLQEECSRMKTQMEEVETIMKETLEFIDKLQVDLVKANNSKFILENRAKMAEEQLAMLQCQVQKL